MALGSTPRTAERRQPHVENHLEEDGIGRAGVLTGGIERSALRPSTEREGPHVPGGAGGVRPYGSSRVCGSRAVEVSERRARWRRRREADPESAHREVAGLQELVRSRSSPKSLDGGFTLMLRMETAPVVGHDGAFPGPENVQCSCRC